MSKQQEKEMASVTNNRGNDTMDRSSINSFWNYCNNAAILLKSSLYQLSPTTGNYF